MKVKIVRTNPRNLPKYLFTTFTGTLKFCKAGSRSASGSGSAKNESGSTTMVKTMIYLPCLN